MGKPNYMVIKLDSVKKKLSPKLAVINSRRSRRKPRFRLKYLKPEKCR